MTDVKLIKNEELESLSLEDKINFIARTSQNIVMNPEKYIHQYNSLIKLLKDQNFVIIKLCSVSISEILIDIAPLYKIKPDEVNDKSEKNLKKEDRKILCFEAELLQFFEKYFKTMASIKDQLSQLIRSKS